MTLREVIEFAKDEGYDGAKKIPYKYEGMEVYEPYFNGGKVACVGYPLVIFVDGEEIRMSDEEESMEVLDIDIEYHAKQKKRIKQYNSDEDDD